MVKSTRIAVTQLVSENRDAILKAWIQSQEARVTDYSIDEETIQRHSAELLDAFVALLKRSQEGGLSPEYQRLLDTMKGITIQRTQMGFTPRDTAHYILGFREIFMDFLAEQFDDEPHRFIEERGQMSNILNDLVLTNFETFVQEREEIIARQQRDLLEVSTPAIQVWEGILVLPIIGVLDSQRAQTLMENMLHRIADTGFGIAILDISGVPTVDTLVAQHLLKAASAARLMGAQCIISGVRPEIAQTIVDLGIDISAVSTKANLYRALKSALEQLGLTVVERNGHAIFGSHP